MEEELRWYVSLVFSDGSSVRAEQSFDTEEQAYAYGLQMRSDYNTGGEILHMSNPGDYPSSWEEPFIDTYQDYS